MAGWLGHDGRNTSHLVGETGMVLDILVVSLIQGPIHCELVAKESVPVGAIFERLILLQDIPPLTLMGRVAPLVFAGGLRVTAPWCFMEATGPKLVAAFP